MSSTTVELWREYLSTHEEQQSQHQRSWFRHKEEEAPKALSPRLPSKRERVPPKKFLAGPASSRVADPGVEWPRVASAKQAAAPMAVDLQWTSQWSEEEDTFLLQWVIANGPRDLNTCAAEMKTGRSGSACSQHYQIHRASTPQAAEEVEHDWVDPWPTDIMGHKPQHEIMDPCGGLSRGELPAEPPELDWQGRCTEIL